MHAYCWVLVEKFSVLTHGIDPILNRYPLFMVNKLIFVIKLRNGSMTLKVIGRFRSLQIDITPRIY